MSDSTDIIIPDLGDFSDVEVIEILVAEGDSVKREDGLITLETDKAALDVPAPDDGVIDSITVSTGDRVSGGDKIGTMTLAGGDDNAAAAEDDDAEPAGDDDAAADGDGDDDGDGDSETDDDERQHADDDAEAEDGSESATPTKEQTVTVPDIGDFSDVDVIEVLVAEGDRIEVDDPLVTLETDKAAMDVPATVAGTVRTLKVAVGDKVSEGSEIAVIEGEPGKPSAAEEKKQSSKPAPQDDNSEPASQPEPQDDNSEPASQPEPARQSGDEGDRPATDDKAVLPPIDEAGFSTAHASPSVRKLARELGVDLASVKGSGPKKRVLHDDVKAFVKSIMKGRATGAGEPSLPKVPAVDFAKFGDIETQALTRIQKISGPRLQASWINLPHVTQHDVADITELEARRQELKGAAKDRGISLTPLAFIMKACVAALAEFPTVNASLSADGTQLVHKKYCHLGFAADTENGLMVPVIRDVDNMDVYEIAEQLGALSAKARDGKLKADQMQGASFTISSLGGIGGTAFTPIVNAPEVAILGVSRSTMQPVWNGNEFVPRLMLPLSLSYDHRVVDGAMAVRFTTYLAKALADVDALLEAIP